MSLSPSVRGPLLHEITAPHLNSLSPFFYPPGNVVAKHESLMSAESADPQLVEAHLNLFSRGMKIVLDHNNTPVSVPVRYADNGTLWCDWNDQKIGAKANVKLWSAALAPELAYDAEG